MFDQTIIRSRLQELIQVLNPRIDVLFGTLVEKDGLDKFPDGALKVAGIGDVVELGQRVDFVQEVREHLSALVQLIHSLLNLAQP